MRLTTKYFKLSNNIFELGLKPNEFVVLAYISRCANNNAKAFPSYNTIADKCNIGLCTAKRIISSLIKKGLITREKRTLNNNGNDTNIYTLTNKVFANETVKNEVIEDNQEDIQEDNQEITEEQDIKETEELIENFYKGEVSVIEQSEQSDLKEKIAIFQSYLNKKVSSKLKKLIESLSWNEIVKTDMQIIDNKKEGYCTENYIINAIYDNKKVSNLGLI